MRKLLSLRYGVDNIFYLSFTDRYFLSAPSHNLKTYSKFVFGKHPKRELIVKISEQSFGFDELKNLQFIELTVGEGRMNFRTYILWFCKFSSVVLVLPDRS